MKQMITKNSLGSLLLVALISSMEISCSSNNEATRVTPEQPREWALQNYHQYSDEAAAVTDADKESAIEKFRQQYKKSGYRMHQNARCKLSWREAQALLEEDGRFSDLKDVEADYYPTDGILKKVTKPQLEKYQYDTWLRLAVMAAEYMAGRESFETIYTEAFLKSIKHYGELEIAQNNYVPRFHESCFMIPTTAVNIYYTFLDRMDAVETGGEATKLEKEVCEMLKVLALQAWTQPLRMDETDNDVSNPERFRKHVWWVGGNGLAYRSLLPAACMIKSIPMIDVLSEVCQRAVNVTSQTTYDTSFWTEGFTADGAGWGHGMQCLIWGYPIDGTMTALDLMTAFRGTVWEKTLSAENKAALFNYLRGSNWYHYKGYNLPCLDRSSFQVKKPDRIKSVILANAMLKNWKSSFTPQEIAEIEQFKQEADNRNIIMENYSPGVYNGTRYFFNNDDLIKRNDRYHLMINMASVRCDGVESAAELDCFNFTHCDGRTFFHRNGNEYMGIIGAFDVLQAPGITARIGEEQLEPIRNWKGFCSKFNFAGGATLGKENAVAGYIFEKMNGSYKENVNDTSGRVDNNQVLYGVQAHKGYFIFGDYLLALGAGVTNLKPEMVGDIRTSIEQTSIEENLYLWRNGKKLPLQKGVQPINASPSTLTWVVQANKFAYTSLPQYAPKAYYEHKEAVACDWLKKNSTNASVKNLPAEVDVLQLWVDHGQTPTNDTYGYVVYAGEGNPAAQLPFTVVRNDVQIQAASSLDGTVIEAVFYDNTATLTLPSGETLSLSQPAVVLLEKLGEKWLISLTDAQMNSELREINITFAGKGGVVPMPQGVLCGKPAEITL